MESSSLNNRILATFIQIKNAIVQILKWNEDIQSSEDYYLSEEGMKILAASCMMIEAIGEGIKKIDSLSKQELLQERPEISWKDIIGIRNHIAHGYFDIDADIIFNIIRTELTKLNLAIEYFIEKYSAA